MVTRRRFFATIVGTALAWIPARLLSASRLLQSPGDQSPAPVELPNREGSFKFAVLGDFGTGNREQYQVGDQMAKLHARFPLDLVITVGDNIYGGERPQDF